MAKLTAPMLSMGARGQIGKSLVVAKWRGITYARQHVVPANPKTTAQMANRTMFALFREMWKLAPALVKAPWDAFATGRPFLGLNKFVGENVRLIGSDVSFINAIMSPGARGGLPPISVVAADAVAAGTVTVTVTPPAVLPDGWTITRAVAAAIVDQDPHGLFTGPFVAGSDDAAPYSIDLAGFSAADDLITFGWIEYEKPDGKAAYSVSLSDAVTVT